MIQSKDGTVCIKGNTSVILADIHALCESLMKIDFPKDLLLIAVQRGIEGELPKAKTDKEILDAAAYDYARIVNGMFGNVMNRKDDENGK